MLKEIINEKYIAALKSRDAEKQLIYQMVKERITRAEKSGKYELPLSDELITDLIAKEYKERDDLRSYYTPGDQAYLMAEASMAELKQYLPQQLTDEEVVLIIKRIKETESNIGKVIGLTVKEVGNRYDRSKIAALVKSV